MEYIINKEIETDIVLKDDLKTALGQHTIVGRSAFDCYIIKIQ